MQYKTNQMEKLGTTEKYMQTTCDVHHIIFTVYSTTLYDARQCAAYIFIKYKDGLDLMLLIIM